MTGRNPAAMNAALVSVALAVILLALAGVALLPSLLTGTAGAAGGTAPPSLRPTPTPGLTLAYPTPSPAPTFTTYVVRPGDSLTSIARAFGTTPRSLSWWNRGTYPSLDPESAGYDPNSIRPGWALVLIPGTTVDEENPPSPSPGPPTPIPSPGPTDDGGAGASPVSS